jgi:pyridoxamine 5'-phosphate oxidase
MNNQDLNTILDNIWNNLSQSTDDLAHPWRLPALSSQGLNGPTVRTVVLRSSDQQKRLITSHTDVRSTKIPSFRKDSRTSWLFYNPITKEQVRANGRAIIQHNNQLTRLAWAKTPLENQYNYATLLPPGSKIENPTPEQRDATNSPDPYLNFAIIECNITEIDWLQLSSNGHRRALFNWNGDTWHKNWITP